VDEWWILFHHSVHLGLELIKATGDMSLVAIEHRGVTRVNLSGVIHDNHLGVKRDGTRSRVLVRIASDIASFRGQARNTAGKNSTQRAELRWALGDAVGSALGEALGAELGALLGRALGLLLGEALGSVLGAALCLLLVSTVEAVSQVTAGCAMARPAVMALVPIVMADPASTLHPSSRCRS
jgi:phage tail tape-measure protein